jgi:heme exporter protein A
MDRAHAVVAAAARAALEGRGLACRRGARLLFRGLDITLPPHSLTWLRGPNGSGKTSLLRLLAGLSLPHAGSVAHGGGQPCFVGHANALKDDLTLLESLGFEAELRGLPRPAACARQALAQMGLAAQGHHLARSLSQGQRRRAALARLALDDAPAAWLLDEPLDALDADGVQRLGRLVQAHAARGGAVLYTSHQGVDWHGQVEFEMGGDS